MSKVKASINPFKQTDKSKNFFQNATDTMTEVIALFVIAVVLAGLSFALFEGKDILTSVWWAIVTGFTVGYGDSVPHTVGGMVTGVLLMTFSTWVILPLIIVTFIKKHVKDPNEFTDAEQNKILKFVDRMNNKLDTEHIQASIEKEVERHK